MKTLIVIVVLALLGYWGFRHGYVKPEWVGLGSPAPSAKGGAGESFQGALSRGVPRMVTGEVSLDHAAANSQGVTFTYRLVDMDQYAVSQRYGSTMPAEMQGALIRDLCTNRAVRDEVLAKGREVQLQVRAQDGHTVFSTQLRPGGC